VTDSDRTWSSKVVTHSWKMAGRKSSLVHIKNMQINLRPLYHLSPVLLAVWCDSIKLAISSRYLTVHPCLQLPNVDTETGVRDKAVPYKVLMKFRTGINMKNRMKPCLGRNGASSGPGVMRVGDQVKVLKLVDIQSTLGCV
jgi:hypothetical protein